MNDSAREPQVPECIFLHFLDHEVLDLYGLDTKDPRIQRELLWATKLAYLCVSQSLLVAQGILFESDPAGRILLDARAAIEIGDIWFARSESDPDDFIDMKREQYKEDPNRYPAYFERYAAQSIKSLGARREDRTLSSSSLIRRAWLYDVESGEGLFDQLSAKRGVGFFERRAQRRRMRSVPESLGKTAFIWPFVEARLPLADLSAQEQGSIKGLITRAYVQSYLEEYQASLCVDFRVGSLDCGIGVGSGRVLSLRGVERVLRYCGLYCMTKTFTWEEIIVLRDEPWFPWFQRLLVAHNRSPHIVAEALRSSTGRFPSVSVDVKLDSAIKRERLINRVEAVALALEQASQRGIGFELMQRRRKPHSADVGIVCAVADEMKAVRTYLSTFSRCKDEFNRRVGRHFLEAQLPASNGIHHVVVTRALEQGNRSIMPACQALVQEYAPTVIVLLGIGGGIHKDMGLCDVVIANEIIYYDKRAVEEGGSSRRLVSYAVKAWLLVELNRLFDGYGDVPVLPAGNGSIGPSFKLQLGPVGTGEAVLKYREAEERAWLRSVNDKTLALETEAGGFAQQFYEDELKELGGADGFLVIRGISDHADRNKDDKWRIPACTNAMVALGRLAALIPVGWRRL